MKRKQKYYNSPSKRYPASSDVVITINSDSEESTQNNGGSNDKGPIEADNKENYIIISSDSEFSEAIDDIIDDEGKQRYDGVSRDQSLDLAESVDFFQDVLPHFEVKPKASITDSRQASSQSALNEMELNSRNGKSGSRDLGTAWVKMEHEVPPKSNASNPTSKRRTSVSVSSDEDMSGNNIETPKVNQLKIPRTITEPKYAMHSRAYLPSKSNHRDPSQPKEEPLNLKQISSRVRSKRPILAEPERRKYKQLSEFFVNKSSNQQKTPQIPKKVADMLKEDPEEQAHYSRMKDIDAILQEEAEEMSSWEKKEARAKEVEESVSKELTSRLQSKGPTSLLPSGAPEEYEGLVKRMKIEESCEVNYNIEAEVKHRVHLLKESSHPPTDFFFFTPFFQTEKYCMPDKSIFKSWYRFLMYVDTPNSMIESGVLLDQMKKNPEEPIPIPVWMWILHSIPAATLLNLKRKQYFDVLTAAIPKCKSAELLKSLHSLFVLAGGNARVISSIFSVASNFKKLPDSFDLLSPAYQPLLSPHHYYFPQTHLLELVLDVVATITTNNETPELIPLAGALICVSAVDASLLYSYTPTLFSNHLDKLFSSTSPETTQPPTLSPPWRMLIRIVCRVIPTAQPHLRLRLLEALNHGASNSVHTFRRCLAASFFLQLLQTPDIETTYHKISDIGWLLSEKILPALSSDGFFKQTAAAITIQLQFLQHALHNISALTVNSKESLLEVLNPYLAKLKRSMRLQTPDMLALTSILDVMVGAIKSSMPINDDVYSHLL